VPYTAEQQAEFKRQFAARRKRQLILAVPLVLVIIAVVVSRRGSGLESLGLPTDMLVGFFIFLVIGALAFSFKNWRCPACDRYLGRDISPRFCPKCGIGLAGE
jgi:Na+/citrate or Na+/malate symporter